MALDLGAPTNSWAQLPPPRRREPAMNLADNLVRSAAQYPDHPAVRLDDALLSYADLDRHSARLATLLADKGMRPGHRVAIMLPNVPEFAVVYFGVLRAGGVVVPMNPLLKEDGRGG